MRVRARATLLYRENGGERKIILAYQGVFLYVAHKVGLSDQINHGILSFFVFPSLLSTFFPLFPRHVYALPLSLPLPVLLHNTSSMILLLRSNTYEQMPNFQMYVDTKPVNASRKRATTTTTTTTTTTASHVAAPE